MSRQVRLLVWRRRYLKRLPVPEDEVSSDRGLLEKILSAFGRSKGSVRSACLIFKSDPFDPRLGTHRISSLSARYQRTIYSVVVEADLRIVFYADGDVIHTLDVGTHSIYR